LDSIDPALRPNSHGTHGERLSHLAIASHLILCSEDDQPAVVRALIKEMSSSPSMASAIRPTQSVQQTSISPVQRKARIAALKDLLDLDVLNLICVSSYIAASDSITELGKKFAQDCHQARHHFNINRLMIVELCRT
jgi:hypothetical protein